MRFRKSFAPLRIGFRYSHEAHLAGMGRGVRTICVKAAVAGAQQNKFERGRGLVARVVGIGVDVQRPISLMHTTRIPRNSTPISSVNKVIANSGVPGRNVASKPTATSTINIAQRNAYRPTSGDSIVLVSLPPSAPARPARARRHDTRPRGAPRSPPDPGATYRSTY